MSTSVLSSPATPYREVNCMLVRLPRVLRAGTMLAFKQACLRPHSPSHLPEPARGWFTKTRMGTTPRAPWMSSAGHMRATGTCTCARGVTCGARRGPFAPTGSCRGRRPGPRRPPRGLPRGGSPSGRLPRQLPPVPWPQHSGPSPRARTNTRSAASWACSGLPAAHSSRLLSYGECPPPLPRRFPRGSPPGRRQFQ